MSQSTSITMRLITNSPIARAKNHERLFRHAPTEWSSRIIELHTERTFRFYPKPMLVEDLFARKRGLLIDNREIPSLSLEDELVLNCIHGAKHFWERLMWVSDIAAVLTHHPEINWDLAWQAAGDAGAERMLRVGALLGASLFGPKPPDTLASQFLLEPEAAKLCSQIHGWLPYAGYAPPPLLRRAKFRADMAGGGVGGAGYLLRLTFSPTEEDWEEGAEERRSWLGEAVRRPFRLLRKYGSGE